MAAEQVIYTNMYMLNLHCLYATFFLLKHFANMKTFHNQLT